ncbi:MAG: hypothetical protein ACXW04_12410 [Methylobacter sp.]
MAFANTDRSKHVKKIINGKAYNTATSVLVCHTKGENEAINILGWGLYYPGEEELYRNRYGAFFILKRDMHKNYHDDYGFENEIKPLTNEEAKKWMELNCQEFIEDYFGDIPEAGSAEVNISLRLPKVLSEKAKKVANSENISLNAWLNKLIKSAVDLSGKVSG